MELIHILLSKRWIIKNENTEVYYQIKDNYDKYHEFFSKKLGYRLIINPLLIKLEKIPGRPQVSMGIEAFKNPKSYVFLCLVLMYLEEMEQGEQFVLAQMIGFVKDHYPSSETIDWTLYSNRTQLIHVLKFCIQESLLLVTDGDVSRFQENEERLEVLYENTGISKYFMRRFPFEIHKINKLSDFEDLEWANDEKDRGLIRRQRIYRRLFMEPIVYDDNDQDYLYIKNMRSHIIHDAEKYLDCVFHLHKNGAHILLNQQSSLTFPNRKAISNVVIQLCGYIRASDLERDAHDYIYISYPKWEQILQTLKEKFSVGWSKELRVESVAVLQKKLEEAMIKYQMIELLEHEVKVLPIVGKFSGDYPKEFWEKNNEQMANK